MRFDLYGLAFETPRVTFYLWSPWRASHLEHRLFDAIRHVPRIELEEAADELRAHAPDPKAARLALQAVARVLKGWQEEAEAGSERRTWRWLLEGDTDADGYDHTGEPVSVWCFLRLGLERGGLGEQEKGEDVDLDGFGLQVPADGPLH
jgi:hypothetical protein